jgi:hypothetical protein
MLNPYYLTRFDCPSCGTFETGTPDRPDLAAKCPWCDEDLVTTAQCRGMTSRPLPFTSDPRAEAPIGDTSVDTINEHTREKRKRNNANGKSTGRPKGTTRSTVYRGPDDPLDVDRRYVERREQERLQKIDRKKAEQNHERKQRKQNGRGSADTSDGPAE